MSEPNNDTIRLVLGESIKLPTGSFTKYEAEYTTDRKSDESMKDFFVRAKKTVSAMAQAMRPKVG